MEGSRIRAISL